MNGPESTLCDACAADIDLAESQPGPEGSEWQDATLCNDCYAEKSLPLANRTQIGPTDI